MANLHTDIAEKLNVGRAEPDVSGKISAESNGLGSNSHIQIMRDSRFTGNESLQPLEVIGQDRASGSLPGTGQPEGAGPTEKPEPANTGKGEKLQEKPQDPDNRPKVDSTKLDYWIDKWEHQDPFASQPKDNRETPLLRHEQER